MSKLTTEQNKLAYPVELAEQALFLQLKTREVIGPGVEQAVTAATISNMRVLLSEFFRKNSGEEQNTNPNQLFEISKQDVLDCIEKLSFDKEEPVLVTAEMQNAGFWDEGSGAWKLSDARLNALIMRQSVVGKYIGRHLRALRMPEDYALEDLQLLREEIDQKRSLLENFSDVFQAAQADSFPRVSIAELEEADKESQGKFANLKARRVFGIDGYVAGKDPVVDNIINSVRAAYYYATDTHYPGLVKRRWELLKELELEVASDAKNVSEFPKLVGDE